MPVKTDRKDAHGIAELMRLGWFRPVHCKSMEAQETRALLTSRKLVQNATRGANGAYVISARRWSDVPSSSLLAAQNTTRPRPS